MKAVVKSSVSEISLEVPGDITLDKFIIKATFSNELSVIPANIFKHNCVILEETEDHVILSPLFEGFEHD